jgi:hypothetical protein
VVKTIKIILYIKIYFKFTKLLKNDNNKYNIVKYKILKDYYFFKKKNPMYYVCSAKNFINIMYSQAYHGSSLVNLFIKKWFSFKVN